MNSLKILLFILFISTLVYAQDGIVKTYYSKGKIKSEESYFNNIYEGTSYYYYPNGNLKEEKTFVRGKLDGTVVRYYESGLVKERFRVKEGVLDGMYEFYYDNGALAGIKKYRDGKLVSSESLDYDSTYEPDLEDYAGTRKQIEKRKNNADFLCDIDVCPQPAGGMEAIYANLVYPEHARMYGLEGVVLVVAKVDRQGNVTGTEIHKSLGLGTDSAAVEAVKQTKFLPGQDGGRLVESEVAINIRFKLDNSGPKITERIEEASPVQEAPAKTETASEPEGNFICELDICPKPEEGLLALVNNIYIPPTAKRAKVKGEVVVKVFVDQYGFVKSAEVIDGLGYGLDEEVVTALYSTRFIPGSLNGKDTGTDVTIRVPLDTTDK